MPLDYFTVFKRLVFNCRWQLRLDYVHFKVNLNLLVLLPRLPLLHVVSLQFYIFQKIPFFHLRYCESLTDPSKLSSRYPNITLSNRLEQCDFSEIIHLVFAFLWMGAMIPKSPSSDARLSFVLYKIPLNAQFFLLLSFSTCSFTSFSSSSSFFCFKFNSLTVLGFLFVLCDVSDFQDHFFIFGHQFFQYTK